MIMCPACGATNYEPMATGYLCLSCGHAWAGSPTRLMDLDIEEFKAPLPPKRDYMGAIPRDEWERLMAMLEWYENDGAQAPSVTR